jgi:shikimate dehydrogenase
MSTSGRRSIVGLIGDPIEASPSPAMHNKAFRALGLDWEYVLVPAGPGRTKEALDIIRSRNMRGANVTVPHKETVIEHLDGLSPVARAIGAVNTIIVTPEGALLGDNTDAAGFLADLVENGVAVKDSSALIVGAGGSARAVAHALAGEKARSVTILNRNVERAGVIASSIALRFDDVQATAGTFPDDMRPCLAGADLVVGCTPPGTSFEGLDFSPDQIVYDLVYRPVVTHLIERAGRCGARTLGGLGMLVYQGALSFEMWTGRPAPFEVMRTAAHAEQGAATC